MTTSPTVVQAAEFTATTTFSNTQYVLVLFAFVVAAFALFAGGVYGAKTSSEVSKAYRASALASTLICWVASLAYLVLILEWIFGFSATTGGLLYAPDPHTIVTELRYMDWTVTVPLLTVELLGVAALSRSQAFKLRLTAVPAAFLMIITGFLGVIFGEDALRGTNYSLYIWGAISTVFFIVLYGVAAQAYRASATVMTTEARISYRNALILLFSFFGAYPLAYLVPIWAGQNYAGWAVAEQLVFTFADIAAKVGFGVLIHKVAKLRTAQDAAEAVPGLDAVAATTPDTIASEVWVSGHLLSTPPLQAAAATTDNGRHVAGTSDRR